MIVYLFMHQEKITMTNRQYFKKVFCLYLIYPLLYTGYLSSRFGMYLNDPLLKNIPYDIIFPYALFN
ncbi:hypothetical protein [Spiroplasma endosymbiont of Glossina fuscipes fuscipes]|uniref:hypothetical protein n=1 Tax=Spiroplasma endosymbiont of Glossina fuscipes fuscipes TaxID=2004463 RepID=UPI003C70E46A